MTGVKRFRFALAGLEKVRQARVDTARLVLARTEAAKRVEEERIMRLEQRIEKTVVDSSREGILDVTAVLEEERFVDELKRQREEALTRLDQWIESVDRDRAHLVELRKEAKALERLRERRYLEFVQEVLREEGQLTDEAASVGDWRMRKEA